MKHRKTIDEHNYTDERHDSYRKICMEMAYDLAIKLVEKENSIYKINGTVEEVLCTYTNAKSKWFETWLILREMIAESDFKTKDYTKLK